MEGGGGGAGEGTYVPKSAYNWDLTKHSVDRAITAT